MGGVIALAAGVALGAPTFEVTILPFPEAGDLNNAGQVAGRGAGALYIWEDGVIILTVPVVGAYPPHQSFQDLSFPRLSESGTLTANVRGATSTGAVEIRAARFNGTLAIDLGTLPGPTGLTFSPWTQVFGINDSGMATGSSYDSSGTARPVTFSAGVATPIGTGQGSSADINNAGQVVGNLSSVGFLANGLSLTSLVPLPGHAASYPAAINAAGLALGRSQETTNAGSDQSMVFWNNGALPAAFGVVPGASLYRPVDLNGAGEVVTQVYIDAESQYVPFFYDAAGTMHDVRTLLDPADPDVTGLTLNTVLGINDSGWMIAQGDKTGTGGVALLLKPVVEVPVLPLLSVQFNPGGGGSFEASVSSQVGFTYRLVRSPDGQAEFLPVGSTVPGTGAPVVVSDAAPPAGTAFYKVIEEPAP